MTNILLTFRRFEAMLTEALTYFKDGKTISWAPRSAGYSPEYVRRIMRAISKAVLEHEEWETNIDRDLLRRAYKEYEWGITENEICFRPRYYTQRIKAAMSLGNVPISYVSGGSDQPAIRSFIKIDGTNREFVERICYLKNYGQVNEDVLLMNLNPALLDEMPTLFPNIDLIQDEQQGEPTPHYILI
jgi:hypothetical protein